MMLELDGDIEVVGEGEDAFSAVALVEKLSPDLVTMDVQMPGKSGLEAVEEIMARRPVPILVVTAEPLSDEAGVAFKAIENGALDIAPKPSFTDAVAAAELRSLVRSLAGTPVFQRASIGAHSPMTVPAPSDGTPEVLVVIAGKGGMPSVMGLLSRFSSPLRCPIILHQPVPPDKVTPYAKHLAMLARQPVKIATDPAASSRPGEILLVLGRRAICERKGELTLQAGEPSASSLLISIAEIYGARAIGVVLAGKGSDGIDGLGALRRVNAPTFAESPLSATINELPLAAVNADVVLAALAIPQLAEQLVVLTALG
jgi:two-component system chemotaxis response regulator CheB